MLVNYHAQTTEGHETVENLGPKSFIRLCPGKVDTLICH